jgi:hypothetical protein
MQISRSCFNCSGEALLSITTCYTGDYYQPRNGRGYSSRNSTASCITDASTPVWPATSAVCGGCTRLCGIPCRSDRSTERGSAGSWAVPLVERCPYSRPGHRFGINKHNVTAVITWYYTVHQRCGEGSHAPTQGTDSVRSSGHRQDHTDARSRGGAALQLPGDVAQPAAKQVMHFCVLKLWFYDSIGLAKLCGGVDIVIRLCACQHGVCQYFVLRRTLIVLRPDPLRCCGCSRLLLVTPSIPV